MFSRFAPVYVIENPGKPYNRIGVPKIYADKDGREIVIVDPATPAVYFEERKFVTELESYTNLIYRIHFPETPADFIPFQLGAGKNVGLIVIVTLNQANHPVLLTTVQTCGCYLAFLPTSYLPEGNFPPDWPEKSQVIYGEKLPAYLDAAGFDPDSEKIMIVLRDGSHRVTDVSLTAQEALNRLEARQAGLYPVSTLDKIPVEGGGSTSFFERAGKQKGYVRNNNKFRERMLMSWWTFDWRIGEDKKLGRNKQESPVFYTSLKPWAREDSDMRDFSAFLSYWGWNL
ncbi:MAG: hypothetical protein OEM01_06900 [Desulfobulbaceae bacterium]|nr:hypothetical protein [Desulfobulbaceae bacterium]